MGGYPGKNRGPKPVDYLKRLENTAQVCDI